MTLTRLNRSSLTLGVLGQPKIPRPTLPERSIARDSDTTQQPWQPGRTRCPLPF